MGLLNLDNSKDQVVFESGAKRSEVVPAYHLIPPEGTERLAKRYTMGADKYGILNYFSGINDPAFVRQLIDHMEEHLAKYKLEGSSKDDNLAAIMWGAMTLCVVEKYNPDIIAEIIDVRTQAIQKAVAKDRPKQNLYEGKSSPK